MELSFLNLCMFTGRVGQDPEVVTFKSGKQVTKFSLAVDRPYRKSEGEEKPQPIWLNVEAWDKPGDIAARYVRKGSLIGIQGEYRMESWVDNTTQAKRSKPVVKVEQLHLLSSLGENGNGTATPKDWSDF